MFSSAYDIKKTRAYMMEMVEMEGTKSKNVLLGDNSGDGITTEYFERLYQLSWEMSTHNVSMIPKI